MANETSSIREINCKEGDVMPHLSPPTQTHHPKSTVEGQAWPHTRTPVHVHVTQTGTGGVAYGGGKGKGAVAGMVTPGGNNKQNSTRLGRREIQVGGRQEVGGVGE